MNLYKFIMHYYLFFDYMWYEIFSKPGENIFMNAVWNPFKN